MGEKVHNRVGSAVHSTMQLSVTQTVRHASRRSSNTVRRQMRC